MWDKHSIELLKLMGSQLIYLVYNHITLLKDYELFQESRDKVVVVMVLLLLLGSVRSLRCTEVHQFVSV